MVMVIVNILVNTRKIQHPTSQRENINQNLLTIIQERVGQIAQPVQTTLLHQVIVPLLLDFILKNQVHVGAKYPRHHIVLNKRGLQPQIVKIRTKNNLYLVIAVIQTTIQKILITKLL